MPDPVAAAEGTDDDKLHVNPSNGKPVMEPSETEQEEDSEAIPLLLSSSSSRNPMNLTS